MREVMHAADNKRHEATLLSRRLPQLHFAANCKTLPPTPTLVAHPHKDAYDVPDVQGILIEWMLDTASGITEVSKLLSSSTLPIATWLPPGCYLVAT